MTALTSTPRPSVFQEPVETILRSRNVRVHERKTGEGARAFRFYTCPVCGKGLKSGSHAKPDECGVLEWAAADGKLSHKVVCWHAEAPDYLGLLEMIGHLSPAKAAEVREGLRRRDDAPRIPAPPARSPVAAAARPPAPVGTGHDRVTPPNEEELKAQTSLLIRLLDGAPMPTAQFETPAAASAARAHADAFFAVRGLTRDTIERFRLGLTRRKERSKSWHALMGPVFDRNGRLAPTRVFYHVPGLTTDDRGRDNGWNFGPCVGYYADPLTTQRELVIVEGMKDLWRTWQALQGTDLARRFLLACASNGTNIPAEWDDAFWSAFDRVYVAADADKAGDAYAEKLALHAAGHTLYRVALPADLAAVSVDPAKHGGRGKDLTDFFQGGRTADEFRTLLERAAPLGIDPTREVAPGEPELIDYRPVDIGSECINGQLYYPVRLVERRPVLEGGKPVLGPDGAPAITEKVVRLVVRSDRSFHYPTRIGAHGGAREGDFVWRLMPDGTQIAPPALTQGFGTSRGWSWGAITRWQRGEFPVRPLRAIVADLEAYLKRAVWLPYAEDYTILAFTMVLSYVQNVFDAVPLVLLNGAKGTGKSELGEALAVLGCNGDVIGQVSAATAVRKLHQTKGLLVFDDLEKIAGEDEQFGDFNQMLKLSYKKSTAVKILTDPKTGQEVTLSFFGVKVIGNTRGSDEILGSRMLRVQTAKMPAGEARDRERDPQVLQTMRNELYAWAFDHAAAVERTYRERFAAATSRFEEIVAPLRVLAAVAEDEGLAATLERGLKRNSAGAGQEEPETVFHEVLVDLVRQGSREVSVDHVVNEMRLRLGEDYGKTHRTQVAPWEDPAWVTRKLRNELWADGTPARPWLWFGRQTRVWTLTEQFLDEIVPALLEAAECERTAAAERQALAEALATAEGDEDDEDGGAGGDHGSLQAVRAEAAHREADHVRVTGWQKERGQWRYRGGAVEPIAFCQGCVHCPYAAGCKLKEAADRYLAAGKKPMQRRGRPTSLAT